VAKETKKPAKRRVKDPVTFRERAVKATAANEKPKAKSRIARQIVRPIKAMGRPVARTVKFLFNRKPFTWLKRPLRIIGKILLPPYIRNSWKELRLVTWPSWSQSVRLTFAVLVFAAIFGLVIAGVDYALDKIFRQLLIS
jgi:preprotein translocase SecE subunit